MQNIFNNINYFSDKLHFYGISTLDVVEINGEPRLQETDTEFTFSYDKVDMKMENLYNGDEVLRKS